MEKMGFGRALILHLISALLFVLSGPGFISPFISFFFFVPAMYALKRIPLSRAIIPGIIQWSLAYGLSNYWLFNSFNAIFNIGLMSSIVVSVTVYIILYGLYNLFVTLVFSSGVKWFFHIITDVKINRLKIIASSLALFIGTPLAWAFIEYMRGDIFPALNFTSLASFYYLFPVFIQSVKITGEYFFSVHVIMINLALFFLLELIIIKKNEILSLLFTRVRFFTILYSSLCIAVILINLTYGKSVISGPVSEPAKDGRFIMVQANTPSEKKWKREFYGDVLDRYINLTRVNLTEKVKVVIWPETALNFYPQFESVYSKKISSFSSDNNVIILTGAPEIEYSRSMKRYYNSIFRIGDGEINSVYRKQMLLPFAEYCPVQLFLPLFKKIIGENQFSSFKKNMPLREEGKKIFFSICFETTSSDLIMKGAIGSDLHIVISDDIWMGDTTGPLQHLAGIVLRSIESGKWTISCVNSGISAIVSPSGSIKSTLSFGDEGVLFFP